MDQEYWDFRWKNKQTGWDLGRPSPPIIEYFTQVPNKNLSILIPGCGNAYEAEELSNMGFKRITLLDISSKAVENIKSRFTDNPNVAIHHQDYFHHDVQYDVIVEQTFFCALPRNKRLDYIKKTSELLKPNGKVIGLLFNKEFDSEDPPFGGTLQEYHKLFSKEFDIKRLETCYNSITPRLSWELFFIFIKRSL